MLSLNASKKRKSSTGLFQMKKKQKRQPEMKNSDDESEPDQQPEQPDLSQILSMPGDKHNLYDYKLDNHIYFTSDVTKLSINKLSKLINAANKEYLLTKINLAGLSSIDQSKILPKPIYLHINSNGGSLSEGMRGIDIIKNSIIPVYTIVEGCAISAASLMFMAGKKRYMTESSAMLIHQMSIDGLSGTYENIKDNFENSKQYMDKIVDIYFKASNGIMKKKQIIDVLKHDLEWDYETCKKNGLVDDLWKGE